jgi:hypothetical protein
MATDRKSNQDEEALNRDKPPLLPAYCDEQLSVEAAQQLVRMAEDTSHPTGEGKELPAADKAALLKKAKLQKTR